MPDPIDIIVTSKADNSGLTSATAQTDKLTDSTKKAGAASADTAKSLNGLGESAEKGAGAGRILGEVMRGNVLAIGQLGPVLKAVGAALLSNPLFTLGALAGSLVLPVLAKIVAGWKSVEDQAKEAGKASADAGSEALAAISDTQQNETAKAFRDIAAAASEARAQIDAVTAAITAQTDADEAVELAAINANPALGNLARAEQTAAARRFFRERRTQTQLGALDAQEDVTATETARVRAEAERKREQEESAARMLAGVEARGPAAVKREIEAAVGRLGGLRGELTGIDPSAREKFQAKQAEIAEAAQREVDLRAELADAEANHAQRLKAAQDRLASATEARADAAEAVAAAEAKQAAEISINQAKRSALRTGEAAANTVSDIALGTARDASRRAAERDGALELFGADAANSATRFAQQLAGSAAAKSNPDVKAAAAALAAAAQAAREGGTTEGEAALIISTMQDVVAVLAAQGRTSATLQREIATLKQQLAAARN